MLKCTGKIRIDTVGIVTGFQTKFLAELSPGDKIQANSTVYEIMSICNDTSLLINQAIEIPELIDYYLIEANPYFRLSNKEVVISKESIPLFLNEGIGNKLSMGQVFTGQFLAKQNPNNYVNPTVVTLPNGYNYITPYTNLSFCKVSENSTIATVPDIGIKVSVIKDKDYIVIPTNYENLASINYLVIGLKVSINNIEYTVIDKTYAEYSTPGSFTYVAYIKVDKVFNYSGTNLKVIIPANYDILYPAGTIVQLNGKMYTVESSAPSSITFKYPMSANDIVTIRKPLVGSLVGLNSIVFSNIDFDKSYLYNNNLVYVQEIRDENDLYGDSIVYGELKTINRSFSSHVIANELNKRQFTGVVHFGLPNNGFYMYSKDARVDSNNLSQVYFYAQNYGMPVINQVVKLGDKLHKITNTYWYSSYTLASITITPPALSGKCVIERPNDIAYGSYSSLIKALCLKLAIYKQTNSLYQLVTIDMLYKLFLYSINYAINLFAKEYTVYNMHNPVYFSTSKYAAAPILYTESFSISKHTSSIGYEYTNRLIRRCGRYIRGAK